MATLRPFRGLRFSPSTGSLDDLTAPPYDVLNAEQRDAYAAKNDHNIVHLTLPESKEDDRSKYVKYARSASLLAEWRRAGALVSEGSPAYYRYSQTFRTEPDGPLLTRVSVIALIKVEPYENGVVLPHEQTFPKHKEDRMRILEATRSHLECIFGLYEDPAGEVLRTLQEAPAGARLECASEDGVHQVLEPITDASAIEKLTALMSDKKVWIADGHHRYETAVAFRAAAGEKEGIVAEDFMMMALSSMADPGLALLPTHRILDRMPLGPSDALAALQRDFTVEPVMKDALVGKMEDGGVHAFGVVLPDGAYLAKPKTDVGSAAAGEGSARLRELDVSILHRTIFADALGVHGTEGIRYTRDPQEALEAVDAGAAAAFLMNPPTVDDMKAIALGGEKMPQKSTYYFPKILSGLVLWSLADF